MTHAATPGATPTSDSTTEAQWTVLCVDDEQNVVSSLRRTLRGNSFRVFTANSGEEALGLLQSEAVDVVISDMRMPIMDGAQFLEQVRIRWPDTVRLLLTGYSDIDSTIGAINRGEIYRYIAKPWDEHDMVMTIRRGLERKALEADKRRLEVLTQCQNIELRDLNVTLEAKVDERTADVRQANADLAAANERLATNFLTSIKVFSTLIEMRESSSYVGHSRRVADLARRLAEKMGLSEQAANDVFIAGLLHDIGKIALHEDVAGTPPGELEGERLLEYRKHPVRGAELLLPLDQLHDAATILRSHCERYDGNGFPDGLAGSAIPLGAAILALAKDYDAAQIGMTQPSGVTAEEALALVVEGRGKHYDPQVVIAFVALAGEGGGGEEDLAEELWIPAGKLAPGMILAADLIGANGALLLAANRRLSPDLIERIQCFRNAAGEPLTVQVSAG